jgi:hypothetical protein
MGDLSLDQAAAVHAFRQSGVTGVESGILSSHGFDLFNDPVMGNGPAGHFISSTGSFMRLSNPGRGARRATDRHVMGNIF